MDEKEPEIHENRALPLFEAKSAVDAVESLVSAAVAMRASDIHIDPAAGGTRIRVRVDGKLVDFAILAARMHDEVIARLKILSGARTDIHAVPQDGRSRMDVGGQAYNMRLSFMPAYRGENCVIRLLPADDGQHASLASLGFRSEHIALIESALAHTSGLILVTGPTGSGKTTTLRACLRIKSGEPLSVMTLEDPVEYEVPGVRHVHIRHDFGVTFASGLRSALRQDPDVIMVGEIRDAETAATAINTALTGHLVLSTLHTNSAVEAILRLLQMGVAGYLIAATLRLVVSQRLVRSICEQCGGDEELAAACDACRRTGFRGRSVVAEVLPIDEAMRGMILRGETMRAIAEHAVREGFEPISADAYEKVEWGVTAHAEAMAALNT